MTDWINAKGETESQYNSNLLPEGAPSGPIVEESYSGEVTFRDGKATYKEDRPAEYQAYAPAAAAANIIDSARNEGGGMIVNRDMRPNDRVTIEGGMETNVATAVQLGYLVRSPDGSYRAGRAAGAGGNGSGDDDDEGSTLGAGMPDEGESGVKLADGTDAAENTEFALDDDAEEVVQQILTSTNRGTAIKAMDEAIMRGEVSDVTLNHLAAQAGVEPEEMSDNINAAHLGFYEAASSHMASRGVLDGEAFMSFLGANPDQAGKINEAARALVMNNSTQGLDEVADSFMERADVYMKDDVKDALDEAGFSYRDHGQGLLIITEEGIEMSFQVAVRQGIVNFS